jgi:hypothetical protein
MKETILVHCTFSREEFGNEIPRGICRAAPEGAIDDSAYAMPEGIA